MLLVLLRPRAGRLEREILTVWRSTLIGIDNYRFTPLLLVYSPPPYLLIDLRRKTVCKRLSLTPVCKYASLCSYAVCR